MNYLHVNKYIFYCEYAISLKWHSSILLFINQFHIIKHWYYMPEILICWGKKKTWALMYFSHMFYINVYDIIKSYLNHFNVSPWSNCSDLQKILIVSHLYLSTQYKNLCWLQCFQFWGRKMMTRLMWVFTPRKPDTAQISYLTMSGTGGSANNILLVCVFYCQETLKISRFFKDVSDIFLRARCFCVHIFY